MYRVWFVNFGYASANEGRTLEEARKIAKKAGFQSSILGPDGTVVATYDPIAGFQERSVSK